ncbi:MAG: TGS domain-containing protein [archaeon]|nr:TGS domain-containing protein [archaeon]
MESNLQKDFLKEFESAFGSVKEAEKGLEFVSNACNESLQKNSCLVHGLELANLLLNLKQRKEVVLAGLIHPLKNIGKYLEKVEKEFGKNVANLLDSKIRFEKALHIKSENKEDSRKKLLVVVSTNPDVIMLHLADALVILRKISEIQLENKDEFISEVQEIFAPLAHKIGIYQISSEMNELAFKQADPKTYSLISNAVNKTVKGVTQDIKKTKEILENELKKEKINTEISGRIKTIYSTYTKMKRKKAGLDKIYDLIALRVITDSIKDCYEVLGIIHSVWKPIPGEFDDYIAKPKGNGYKALHAAIQSHMGNPIEIQIKTKEMHDEAEYGIASHWIYKGGEKDSKFDKKIEWIKQILDWQKTSNDQTENRIFEKEIFALTPKGQVIELPDGATVIDFAYAVHSDIGNHCQNAKINGSIAPLHTVIKNSDIVEIITSQKQVPKMNWLGFVKTSKAKQKIRAKLQIQKSNKTSLLNKDTAQKIKINDKKIRIAKCCTPVPGDDIIGLKTTKRKISVHRTDCDEVSGYKGTLIGVSWHGSGNDYKTELIVHASDRLGLLKDLLEVISKSNITVSSTNAKISSNNSVQCKFGLKIKNVSQLEELSKKISNVKGVTKVYRE